MTCRTRACTLPQMSTPSPSSIRFLKVNHHRRGRQSMLKDYLTRSTAVCARCPRLSYHFDPTSDLFTTVAHILACAQKSTVPAATQRANVATVPPARAAMLKRSYFALLPPQAMVHVARHLSARPRNANWTAWLSPADALALLVAGGPFADLCRLALDESKSGGVIEIDEGDNEQYWDLLREMGPSLKELSVQKAVWPSSIDGFRGSLRNLRALRVCLDSAGDRFADVLRVCAGNLKELALDGVVLRRPHIDAIAAHCTGLEALGLAQKYTEKGLQAIWATVGATLTSISLQRLAIDNVTTGKLHDLSSGLVFRCYKVTEVELIDSRFSKASAMVRFCERLGKRLKVLRLPEEFSCLSPNTLRIILEKCPNAVVDAWIDGCDVKTLLVLKDRVRKLFMYSNAEGKGSQLEEAAHGLTKVEQIEIRADEVVKESVPFLSRLFSTPKPALRELIMWHMDFDEEEEDDFREMYRVLARLVNTLEVFECLSLSGVPDEMQLLAEANLNLACVKVEFEISMPVSYTDDEYSSDEDKAGSDREEGDGDASEKERAKDEKYARKREEDAKEFVTKRNSLQEDAAVKLVAAFSRCPLLRELVLSNDYLDFRSQRIADSCGAFHGREIDIFVAGIQYVP